MAIKGCKTIAEYAIRKWLVKEGLDSEFFSLDVHGNEGTLKDMQGNSMVLVYDPGNKSVYPK